MTMTEAEWLASKDPDRMVCALYRKASDRKLRLLACACFAMLEDKYWCLQLDPAIRAVVQVAERFADGQATPKERTAALRSAGKLQDDFSLAAKYLVQKDTWESARRTIKAIAQELSGMGYAHEESEILGQANETLAEVVRENFGTGPVRPITFNTAWRTSDVITLAQGIYDGKAFDRMPILADAIQDAGCDSEDILDHCRDADRTHVRGCWALDLILGKE